MLEVTSSSISGLISFNQFMRVLNGSVIFFKGCALPLSLLSHWPPLDVGEEVAGNGSGWKPVPPSHPRLMPSAGQEPWLKIRQEMFSELP